MNLKRGLTGLCMSLLACVGMAHAVDNPEIEPNDTKTLATIADSAGVGMDVGDTISGTTTGISTSTAGAASADYFRVKTKAKALGIYRYLSLIHI